MNKYQQHELCRILVASLDQGATEEEFRKVDALLSTDPEAVDFYIHFMKIYSRFAKPGRLFAENQLNPAINPAFDLELWKDLALDERHAPPVIMAPPPEMPLIRKVERNRHARQINKTSLISAMIAAAAVLLIIVFARISPSHHGIEVATLSDSINAEWAQINYPMVNGIRLETSFTPLTLKNGIAEITFDNKASLVVESPAEFELVAKDQVKLNYGKLYAVIGSEAIGFTVNTPNAKIIDLGTEFAVKADHDKGTEVHVIKGQTCLIAGGKNRRPFQVFAGTAKSVTGPEQTVYEIACRKQEFARRIDSTQNVVWRGQSLDAANLIAGGNGLGTEPYFTRIDSRTGESREHPQPEAPNDTPCSNAYRPGVSSNVIDGIAVPSGLTSVSSENHRFEFIETSGILSWDIIAFNQQNTLPEQEFHPPVFNRGQMYGKTRSPAVLLHSNVLLTFDLSKIRNILPQGTISLFKTKGGITELVADRPDKAKVDFLILVDGHLRYEKKDVTVESGLFTIEVPLEAQDQFLTLAVTEGSGASEQWYPAFANDFFYLINPEFVF